MTRLLQKNMLSFSDSFILTKSVSPTRGFRFMTKKRKSRSTGLPAFVGQQDYQKLKAECFKTKQKFVDLAFPPENSSLFLDAERSSDIIWKRPEVSSRF